MIEELKAAAEQAVEKAHKCQMDWDLLIRTALGIGVGAILLFLFLRWAFRRKQCYACGRALIDLSKELDNADLLMEQPGQRDAYTQTTVQVLAYLNVKGVVPDAIRMDHKKWKQVIADVSHIIACDWRS